MIALKKRVQYFTAAQETITYGSMSTGGEILLFDSIYKKAKSLSLALAKITLQGVAREILSYQLLRRDGVMKSKLLHFKRKQLIAEARN